jgi:hypothetical protein
MRFLEKNPFLSEHLGLCGSRKSGLSLHLYFTGALQTAAVAFGQVIRVAVPDLQSEAFSSAYAACVEPSVCCDPNEL